MENAIEFIRDILDRRNGREIDLSQFVTEGEYTVFIGPDDHIHRYWSPCVREDIDLDEGDFDDDIPFIMDCFAEVLTKKLK